MKGKVHYLLYENPELFFPINQLGYALVFMKLYSTTDIRKISNKKQEDKQELQLGDNDPLK